MALLQKLKSILGLGGSDRDAGERREVGVTVEREGGDRTAAASEGGDGAGTAAPTDSAETTTSAETTPDTDGPAGTDAGDTATEDGDDTATSEDGEHEAADETSDGDDLEDVKGVGPAYAQRLRDAGVGSVAELADADADDLADRTDLSANRIGNWIERARGR